MSICIRSPASIANLGPGFDIMSLAITEPYDDVYVEIGHNGNDYIKFVGDYLHYLPSDYKSTTMYPVIEEFRRITGLDFKVRITVRKGIKPASGLGSSGADAAALTYALNKLLGTNLDSKSLIRIAALGETAAAGVPHMDNVAASLLGGLVIINPVTGDFVKVEVPSNYWIVVVLAGSKVSTGEMRKLLPSAIDMRDFKNNSAYASMLIYSLITNNREILSRALMGDSIVEPIRIKFYPHYGIIKETLLKVGAIGVALSGAGPSLFGVFDSEPPRDRIDELLRKSGLRDYVLIITKPTNTGTREVPCNQLNT
ncbi:homoserine kinase [Vulcanisaeta souniana]|uniref:Homoserine kinase n=1 Tax=Vulcanisaeta souniana JCM 11219 TaxID=1293586 RepID=A0A830E5G1_9CREN|nr:homoserine kinase [Vulcanisaeta souniana]BDR91433.1 homoserine kinase [Vulcanisaeta souniana JCM 11219]GGI73134.1 homoserine kinase [Vulcanisaeta souniana JCM 11219]